MYVKNKNTRVSKLIKKINITYRYKINYINTIKGYVCVSKNIQGDS